MSVSEVSLFWPVKEVGEKEGLIAASAVCRNMIALPCGADAVSYTHLTLPTIYSV